MTETRLTISFTGTIKSKPGITPFIILNRTFDHKPTYEEIFLEIRKKHDFKSSEFIHILNHTMGYQYAIME